MKIVVFGTGYVGSAIVRELAARGHEVTAVSRSAARACRRRSPPSPGACTIPRS